MFTKLVTGSFLTLAALFGAAWAAEPAQDCCAKKLACCQEKSACCAAETKLGCCQKGSKCCAEKRACCTGPQACCVKGEDCCAKSLACCGEKATTSAGAKQAVHSQDVKACCGSGVKKSV